MIRTIEAGALLDSQILAFAMPALIKVSSRAAATVLAENYTELPFS